VTYVSDVPPLSREALNEGHPLDESGWLKRVCRIGEGHACCRYVTMDGDGFDCAKHGEFRAHLDHRVSMETINARGDNCPGLGAGISADKREVVQ